MVKRRSEMSGATRKPKKVTPTVAAEPEADAVDEIAQSDEVHELEVVDGDDEILVAPTNAFEDDDIEIEVPTDAEEEKSRSRAVVPYNPLQAYLNEIRRFHPLSKEDELQAAIEYRTSHSPDAAFKLVSGNLWLVVKIARDYERVARNVLDLIQEGNIGLMEAVKNFDPYRGVRFPSYAVWWIKAYIIRFIIANWRLVKIGTTQAQRKLFFNLKKESDRLEREGIRPTPKLLAEKLNVKEGDVIEMSQRMAGPDMSVDAPLQDDSEGTLHGLLPSSVESAESQVARREIRELLLDAVDEFSHRLSDKEQLILRKRILDDEKSTLQELSDQLHLSKERVRQIENKLREKLKLHIMDKAGAELDDWLGGVNGKATENR